MVVFSPFSKGPASSGRSGRLHEAYSTTEVRIRSSSDHPGLVHQNQAYLYRVSSRLPEDHVGAMGCKCSKTHIQPPSEQAKRRRASLQLDLSASVPDVEPLSTVTHKKLRTPAVTPRSVSTADSSKERSRRVYPATSIQTCAWDPSPGSLRTVSLRTLTNHSSSTGDISVESEGDDDAGVGNAISGYSERTKSATSHEATAERRLGLPLPCLREDIDSSPRRERCIEQGTAI